MDELRHVTEYVVDTTKENPPSRFVGIPYPILFHGNQVCFFVFYFFVISFCIFLSVFFWLRILNFVSIFFLKIKNLFFLSILLIFLSSPFSFSFLLSPFSFLLSLFLPPSKKKGGHPMPPKPQPQTRIQSSSANVTNQNATPIRFTKTMFRVGSMCYFGGVALS